MEGGEESTEGGERSDTYGVYTTFPHLYTLPQRLEKVYANFMISGQSCSYVAPRLMHRAGQNSYCKNKSVACIL